MICGIWGEDKSCKTTLGLTWPKPLHYFEFDYGGFDRAAVRFKDDIAKKLIIPKPFILPVQAIITKEVVRMSKRLIGIKEMWYKFLEAYIKDLEDPKVATIMLDTGTLLWETDHRGYLQELQEGKPRESLLPVEYGEPNARMRAVLYAAKAEKKNLIITHHAGDEYKTQPVVQRDGSIKNEGVPTGKRIREGWKKLGDMADIMIHTYTEWNKAESRLYPWCEFDPESVPMEIVGQKLLEPSYDKIMNLIEGLTG